MTGHYSQCLAAAASTALSLNGDASLFAQGLKYAITKEESEVEMLCALQYRIVRAEGRARILKHAFGEFLFWADEKTNKKKDRLKCKK